MTFIYNSTIDTFPGAIFLVQAGNYLFNVLVMVYSLYLLTRVGVPYGSFTDEDDDEGSDDRGHIIDNEVEVTSEEVASRVII